MSKIRTYQNLLDEKIQLEAELAIKRAFIRNDVAKLKEEWRPVTDLLSVLAKFTTKGRTNPLLSIGIELLGDVFVKNFLLAKSSWITRLVVPFLAKTYSANFLNKNGSSIVHQLIDKLKNRHSNGRSAIENL